MSTIKLDLGEIAYFVEVESFRRNHRHRPNYATVLAEFTRSIGGKP